MDHRNPIFSTDTPDNGLDSIQGWFPALVLGLGGLVFISLPLLMPMGSGTTLLCLLIGAPVVWAGISLGFNHASGELRYIRVDFDIRTISFEHFHIGRPFRLSLRTTPQLSIRFEELLAAKLLRNPSGPSTLYIITTHGRIKLSQSAVNFESLRDALQEIAAPNPPPPFALTPTFTWLMAFIGMGLIAAVIAGGGALGWMDPVLDALR